MYFEVISMRRLLLAVSLAFSAAVVFPQIADAGHSEYDALIATHASANNVPEALVHRVIQRESRYQPRLIGRCGCIGLMQIKLATARGLGYAGNAEGLRDPNTNLTYGVKYLAGAYRAANGDHGRAIHYYAAGYYQAAKRRPREPMAATPLQLSSSPQWALPVTLPNGKSSASARAQVPKP
jgi:soluble lytic murein transglycosylase-like protein